MGQAAKKCVVGFQPSGLKVEVAAGTNLLQAARKAGIYLSSICGGDGYCGKCKVAINEGRFETGKTALLTADEVSNNVVLACLTNALSDMVVTVPGLHSLEVSRILTESNAHEKVFDFDPLVRKLRVEMSPPTVHDHTADSERLAAAIRSQVDAPVADMGLEILRGLSKVLVQNNYKVSVTIADRAGAVEITDIEPANCSGTNYAAAVDIGTTTVVAHLVDLTNGATVDTEAMYNSQLAFGEDYIRRIMYAEVHDAFDELQSRIVGDVNNLIKTLAERQGIDLRDITAVVCAGNTAMIHFLLKLDATRIRREPYVPSVNVVPAIPAAQAGIRINARGTLYCLPSVAAYVGGDIVAGVLATRVYTQQGTSLFVDIGTNGEVVLGNRDWLVCASSSAGPAFEGSGIRCGMRAGSGAIEKLSIAPDGSVKYKTIGDADPVGICGTGLLDTLAGLYVNGIIDRTGRLHAGSDKRLKEGEDGLQFQLVMPGDGRQEIVITQPDIDNLIRSKAGVFAAIRVLMNSTQTKTEDLEAIYVAGGFGNFLDVRAAVTVGMLPDITPDKIHFVGNTSIGGAKTVLMSRKALQTAQQIAESMTYFDLMSHTEYMDEFIKANFLPHTDLSLFPSVKANTGKAQRD
jgi:uncharacterized 2Fe-2S/4Fe-4S cluster protein (DUF4445 family)